MNWLEFSNIVAAIGVSSALNSLWLGLLLVTLAMGMLQLLPRSNATTRYMVWFVALILLSATPALLLIPRPVSATPAVAAPSTPISVPVTAHWPLYLALAWTVISALLLARVAWSLIHINGLKRRATLLGRRDNIRVLSSSEVRVPIAAGFLRPAIVFPQSVIAELSSEELEQVLSHELAHIRRWDDWTQLVQALVEAVLFFNPAIYWIGRRLKIEREMACDDWVVAATGEPRPYAACLTHLYELTRRASAPQLASGATTRKRWQISTRIEALLEPGRNSTPCLSRSGWMAACALACAALIVAAKTTPPVGVQELPLAPMTFAQLHAPAAPAISLAPRRSVQPRPHLVASRMPKPELPVVPASVSDPPYLLVRAWQVDISPSFYVITVVFFEPPPPTVLNGI